MFTRWLPLLLLSLSVSLFNSGVLFADGPHWHVPNPDGEDDETLDPNGDNKKVANPIPAGGNAGRHNGVADWNKNPGDFFKMDALCIDYYERHCVIRYSKNRGNEDFYIKIMNRCAQAMREVDNYLPCPDAFPLWHTEELRELMVQFSQMTWQRSTMLDRKTAQKCAAFCVEAYIDTVRFADQRAGKRLAAAAQAFVDLNDKLVAVLEKAGNEEDPKKKKALLLQWRALHNKGHTVAIPAGLVKAFNTFKMITGDIPVQVDMAESRMLEGLANMGTIVLPYLNKHARSPNKRVQKAVWNVVSYIRSKMNSPANTTPTMSNIMTQLRYLQKKPGSIEAGMAIKNLKKMGDLALPTLIRIAENKTLDLRSLALKAMSVVSKKNFGLNISKWKAYSDEIQAANSAAKTKAQADSKKRQARARAEAEARDEEVAKPKGRKAVQEEEEE